MRGVAQSRVAVGLQGEGATGGGEQTGAGPTASGKMKKVCAAREQSSEEDGNELNTILVNTALNERFERRQRWEMRRRSRVKSEGRDDGVYNAVESVEGTVEVDGGHG